MKKIIAAVAGALLAVSLAGCTGGAESGTAEEYPGGTYNGKKTGCVVNDKQAISRVDSDGNNSTDYRIYTDNCGVFGVQDDMFIGQWNSADTFGSIKIGGVYDFEAYGFRNGVISAFPNIKRAMLTQEEG